MVQGRPPRQQDSGWSYLVLACGTLGQVVNMGLVLSYGVQFPAIIKQFHSSRQQTAWIGSLCRALLFFAGPVASRLTERYNCRFVTLVGAVTVAVGFTLTSFAKSITIYYFTYGLLVGFGSCCIRISSFLIIARYFHKRKPLAMGLIGAGGSLGLFVFAQLTQTFLDKFGLNNTFRILAGVQIVTGSAALSYDPNVVENPPQGSAEPEDNNTNDEEGESKIKIVDCSLWKVPVFTIFSLAFMMNSLGRSIPYIHLVKYAEEQGISSDQASRILTFIGLVSCIAQIMAGFVCNLKFVNPHYVLQGGVFISAVPVILYTIKRTYSFFVLFSVFFGLGQGTLSATINIIFLTCVDNKRRASAFGLANCLNSLAIVSSPPLAGFLADELGSYAPAFYFAGSALIACSLLPFILLCIKAKETLETEQEVIAVEEVEYLSAC